MAISISIVIKKLTLIIKKIKPDILIIYGDRFETLGAAIAGHENNILVGHLEGGDVTNGGTHDDNIRHSITKLSHFHFTTNTLSYNRVLALGEEKWRVKMVGFTAIDLIREKKFSDKKEVIKKYNLKKQNVVLLLTFHPLSFSLEKTKSEINNTLASIQDILNKFSVTCIFTYPNNDVGSEYIISKIKLLSKKHKNIKLYKSLGRRDYWGIMNLIKFNYKIICIGNSSSGIKEAGAFFCPAVNIGDRQKGRLAGKNVVHISADKKTVSRKLEELIKYDTFFKKCKKYPNPYGKGRAGEKVANFLNELVLSEKLILKKITI